MLKRIRIACYFTFVVLTIAVLTLIYAVIQSADWWPPIATLALTLSLLLGFLCGRIYSIEGRVTML
jgi:uncharacterized ion transporter superfamily protein YfcC